MFILPFHGSLVLPFNILVAGTPIHRGRWVLGSKESPILSPLSISCLLSPGRIRKGGQQHAVTGHPRSKNIVSMSDQGPSTKLPCPRHMDLHARARAPHSRKDTTMHHACKLQQTGHWGTRQTKRPAKRSLHSALQQTQAGRYTIRYLHTEVHEPATVVLLPTSAPP